MAASARMLRKGLESAASHGIPPPGTDPRFKCNHRSRAQFSEGGRFADVCRAGIRWADLHRIAAAGDSVSPIIRAYAAVSEWSQRIESTLRQFLRKCLWAALAIGALIHGMLGSGRFPVVGAIVAEHCVHRNSACTPRCRTAAPATPVSAGMNAGMGPRRLHSSCTPWNPR